MRLGNTTEELDRQLVINTNIYGLNTRLTSQLQRLDAEWCVLIVKAVYVGVYGQLAVELFRGVSNAWIRRKERSCYCSMSNAKRFVCRDQTLIEVDFNFSASILVASF